MKHFFSLFLLLALGTACQQKQAADIPEVKIHPVQHGSLVVEYNGKFLYVDPAWGANKYAKYNGGKPDGVLITHPHGDHCSPETLEGLKLADATLILPTAKQAHEKTASLPFKKRETLKNGDELEWEGINIQAIPMYNLPQDSTSRHAKGWGNGYVLTAGGKRIYISGDTEDIPEMRNLKDIDIAFVCMNLPYTMAVAQAIDAVAAFKPKTVYPYHYRGQDPKFSDVEEFKRQLNEKAPEVEVILAKWY